MSKTSKNILGDQRGKIGKVVGKVVDGVQMYSAYTESVRNPRTAKQIAHRARFATAIAIGKAMKGAINVGLKNIAANRKLQSAFNVFIHENMPHITYNPETGVTTPDYAHITMAEGNTPHVSFGALSFSEALTVSVTFTGNSDIPGANDDDSVYLLVYAPALGRSMMTIAGRSTGSVSVTLPATWAGETVHVWGFVRTSVKEPTTIDTYGITLRPDGCSESSYLGSGMVSGE